jgi:shikimate kinase
MGSGKSTVGPVLANTLGYTFVDLDGAIEAQTGATIAGLIRDRGEAEFRRIEREVFLEASSPERLVIALGGGAITDTQTLAHAHATGVLVYLRLSLDEILTRVQRTIDRPLLLSPQGTPMSNEALQERVRSLLAAREPLYLTADIVVHVSGGDLGRTVDTIARELGQFLPR